jgi:hypothetical protein
MQDWEAAELAHHLTSTLVRKAYRLDPSPPIAGAT